MRRVGSLLGILLLAGGIGLAAEPEWSWSCRFTVEVEGKPVEGAALFERRGSADLLGLLPDGTWFLAKPPRQVFELPAGAVERDGLTAVLQQEPASGGTPLTLTPSGLTFDVAGKWLRVIPTPVLLGETTPEKFLSLCPEFERREEEYQPKAESVRQIAATSRSLTLEIYFGSWCPHCQEVLPRLFKSLRMAHNDNLVVKMIGLPRAFGQEAVVRARQIRGVPTIIVTDPGGAEVGRFSGTEQTAIEDTLAQVVGG